MKVFKDLHNLPKFRNAVITVGTFDGVHQGHQQILSKLNDLALKNQGESILITFHPHPRFIVNPNDNSLKLINNLDEKIELLQKYSIDNLIIVPFTASFSEISAEEYVEDFLLKNFDPSVIVIGYDHHFGKGRKGNINLLKKYQDIYQFQIELIEKKELENITISSTKIRKAIKEGQVDLAKELMNHHFTLQGVVSKGVQMGRVLGFPTANIEIAENYKLLPKMGVYAVLVHIDNTQYFGMLNIGKNPTFKKREKSIEVNIFNFDEDIYNKKIKISFVYRLRNEQKFDSKEELKLQLDIDKKKALKLLQP